MGPPSHGQAGRVGALSVRSTEIDRLVATTVTFPGLGFLQRLGGRVGAEMRGQPSSQENDHP